ncbi:MAG TPA: hypothetical protein DF296_01925 [Candidatus Margulisbacteria bacterium]|nr:MAG: hypothetical protein A2X42_03305 [Candidatus Margulisbacteria bacterium GWF2_38_17]OGI06627.1 MAG: hypothetical protein A2X41_05475 [Candidatus Margulisbacteria bacterium GWE2_39_32]HCT83935.1 hypothetical protein [Candidatus Margulisiibacteriota bacterium]
MKILLVHYRYFISGGPERYMFNIKKELEKSGHEVIPFSTRHSSNVKSKYEHFFTKNIGGEEGIFFDEYRKNAKTYLDVIGRQFYSFQVKNDLERIIRETRPDVCYLLHYVNKLSPSVITACKRYNVPIVHRLSDYYLMCPQSGFFRDGRFCDECKDKKLSVIKHKCVKNSHAASCLKYLAYSFHNFVGIYDHINTFICTNNYMREKLIEFGFDKNKLAVNHTFFNSDTWNIDQTYQRNRLPQGKINLICVGNFDHSKGTYDLLQAIDSLKDLHSQFRLTLIGGRLKKEIANVEKYISTNHLEDLVKVMPITSTEKLIEVYQQADASILPSRIVENLPNVMLESLFFELPLVVPSFGSFKSTVDDTISFKFQAFDVTSLANTLRTIINDPAKIEEKRQRCKQYLEKNFSKAAHVEKLIGIFESVSHHKGQGIAQMQTRAISIDYNH